ncbi:carboxylesterase/lipase family protein [Planctomycetes bacterium TBK1r]|uniref:Carboxylic ester hydrolase n=1 Tax=Stieleria magnilauensis TaxID=2527963 RepID=A0ABX5XJV8_9BACT|nr:Fumonisin B1 esterase [Planctomycetes bacterium TBK1r]
MRAPTPLLLLIVSLAFGTTILSANDFTRFRGADATGVANDHPKLPDHWSKTENVAWVADVPGQGWGSPIIVGDRVFVSSVVAEEENIKPKGGLYLGQGVRDPAKGIFTASPWAYNGKLFCLSEDGLTYVIKAGPEFEILNTNPLDELCIATPSVVGDKLLVRTQTKVYCVTQGAKLAAVESNDESAIVQTRLGPVAGTASRDDSIEVFKGIPYAAPPVGHLRWRPPQPAAKWSDVRKCDKFAARSLQTNNRPNQSEDCLYLNVWTARERVREKRPVMVWIHGGGFTQGSGHQPGYDGTQLAKRGVVAVTINYRLGALGFMTHPALSAESPRGSSGNYAILDQIAALEWVRDNIANFGGDPENVTIFGESAGGTSIYLLTATPLSKGLFHRAILQSPWLDPVIFRDLKDENANGPPAEFDGEEQARKLLGSDAGNGDAEGDAVLAKLRAIPASEVLGKVKQRWPIATDGWVFPKPPHQIYADGEQHDIPVIVGTNRDEGTMFAPRKAFGGTLETYKQAMVERFGEHGDQVADFYAPKSQDDLWKVAVQQITDVWFIQPSREFARAMDKQDTDVWMYHFTKPVWGWMGAAHAAEIGYVFGNLEEPKPDDAELSRAFMDYWVQFAKTGNPNVEGNPEWPRYTTAEDRHLVMDKAIDVDSGLRSEACNLLNDMRRERRNQAVPQHEFRKD